MSFFVRMRNSLQKLLKRGLFVLDQVGASVGRVREDLIAEHLLLDGGFEYAVVNLEVLGKGDVEGRFVAGVGCQSGCRGRTEVVAAGEGNALRESARTLQLCELVECVRMEAEAELLVCFPYRAMGRELAERVKLL